MRIYEIISLRSLPGCLKKAHRVSGLSLRQIARYTRVSSSAISRVENGEMCTAYAYVRLSDWTLLTLRAYEAELES